MNRPDVAKSFCLNEDLNIRNLSKSYGTCFKTEVISDLTFDINEQQAFGLVGPNGSGKSTTFEILAGQLSKTAGHLFLDGSLKFNLFSVKNTLFWKQNVAVCYQNDFLYDNMTVEQHISFFAALNGLRYYCKKVIPSPPTDFPNDLDRDISDQIVSPQESKNRNPFIQDLEIAFDIKRFRRTKAKNLSSGNKRKVCILISLLKNIEIGLWDEATCGLDVLARHSIRQLLFVLKKRNKAKLMITTHFLNDVDLYCDQIGILNHKKFAFIGSTETLKNEFGGYCVLVRGSNSTMEDFLTGLQNVSSFRVLEQQQMQDEVVTREESDERRLEEIKEEDSDNISGTDQSENQNTDQQIDNLESLKHETKSVQNKLVKRRVSLDVRFREGSLQSVIKLHIEQFQKVSRLFEYLQNAVEEGLLYEFFLNQYNVEHIYVDIINQNI